MQPRKYFGTGFLDAPVPPVRFSAVMVPLNIGPLTKWAAYQSLGSQQARTLSQFAPSDSSGNRYLATFVPQYIDHKGENVGNAPPGVALLTACGWKAAECDTSASPAGSGEGR